MNYDIAIILLLIVVLASNFLFNRLLVRLIVENIYQLDQNIAEALKSTIENLPESLTGGDFPDPPNPIQMMVMQMIQDKMKPATITVNEIVPKGKDGKFTSTKDISS